MMKSQILSVPQAAPIKIWRFALCLLVPLLPVVDAASGINGFTPIVLFIILPVIAKLIGSDFTPNSIVSAASQNKIIALNALPVLTALIAAVVFIWLLFLFRANWNWNLAISWCLVASMLTCCGHELIHSNHLLIRRTGHALYIMFGYGSFPFEHQRHHKRAGDSTDDVADKNQSVYTYFAHEIHKTNFNTRYITSLLAMMFLSYLIGNENGLFLFLMTSVSVWILLQTINYVQHYGLRAGGHAFAQNHAWIDPCPLMNILLFSITRHSEHHRRPLARYWTLNIPFRSPVLPQSYSTMLILALIPPLWFAVMNPRLDRIVATASKR
jgi:alkane 1-monooxygenase